MIYTLLILLILVAFVFITLVQIVFFKKEANGLLAGLSSVLIILFSAFLKISLEMMNTNNPVKVERTLEIEPYLVEQMISGALILAVFYIFFSIVKYVFWLLENRGKDIDID